MRHWAVRCGLLIAAVVSGSAFAQVVDLAGARVVVDSEIPVQQAAAALLQEEIEARTGIRLVVSGEAGGGSGSTVVLGTPAAFPGGMPAMPEGLAVPEKAEGYALWVASMSGGAVKVCLAGRDNRGVLYAAGRLLRALQMGPGRAELPGPVSVSAAPAYPVRGFELGYRGLANSYDRWDLDQYRQCVQDLVVFGANAVQLIPGTEPFQQGPYMTESSWERCAGVARICQEYGMDVWLWVRHAAHLGPEGEGRARTLEERRRLFEAVQPLSAVFLPRGRLEAGEMLTNMGLLAEVLHEVHPKAQLWLSSENETNRPDASWNDSLFGHLRREEPDWLAGMVFDTWQEFTLAEQRAQVPARYPLVRYPDITHCIECQYPVPHWDRAFAQTLGREPINPRPRATAYIHDLLAHDSIGFVAYSDGCHDDVNKMVWVQKAWDPERPVEEILQDYGRYFIGPDYGEAMDKGMRALERNWEGPLRENPGIEGTLAFWKDLEERAAPEVLGNWRFLMGLYRAYYDAFLQRKLEQETLAEQEALAALGRAGETGARQAIEAAEQALAVVDGEPAARDLYSRLQELGKELFERIGLQLDVRRYGASTWERGATLDGLERPLNNRLWLERRFAAIAEAGSEEERLALIDEILHWEDPGEGGFYDDLGCAGRQPHLVNAERWEADPGFVESPQDEHIEVVTRIDERTGEVAMRPWRQSWFDQAQTLYSTPLEMRYTGLDPKARYRLRVVYTGRFRPTMRLVADGAYTIHEALPQPSEPERLEFEVPTEASADSILALAWHRIEGRGAQVAEVWLVRTD